MLNHKTLLNYLSSIWLRSEFLLIVLSLICPQLFLLNTISAQDMLKELNVSIQKVDKAVAAQPNSSKLIIKSEIPGLRFESNRGIIKVENRGDGEWRLSIYPGNQRFEIKADGFISYSKRITFDPQKVYECTVSEKNNVIFRSIEEESYEIKFTFNVIDVHCSIDNLASNISIGNQSIFKLPEGRFSFHFRKNSFEPMTKPIVVSGDTTYYIKLAENANFHKEYTPPAIVVIKTNPENAEIILNGQTFGYSPATLNRISKGRHTLELRKSKYYSDFYTFTINEGGEVVDIDRTLKPQFGFLDIISHPGKCEIFIDNKSIGFTPIKNFEILSGKYQLVGKKDLYHDYYSKEFEIKDNDSLPIEFDLDAAFGTLKISSMPENDVNIKIDGKVVGKTPYANKKFPSGNISVELSKKYYRTINIELTVYDNKVTDRKFPLNQTVGTLIIKSDNADLYLNNEFVSQAHNNI